MSKKSSTHDSSILEIFNALFKFVDDRNDEVKKKKLLPTSSIARTSRLETSKLASSISTTSIIDASISAAKSFFERQAIGGLSLIIPRESVDDFVAIKGQPTQLTFASGFAQAFVGVRVQFFIADKKVGEAAIGPELKARIKIIPKDAGCFSLSYRIISKTGVEIFDARKQEDILLQVLDNKPVICVDAELITNKKTNIDKQLAQFSEEGFDIVYIDFGKLDRVEELRQIRHLRELPKGSIISLTARIKKFESFSTDFKQSFLSLAINRLRADGVPVVSLITHLAVSKEFLFPEIDVFKENITLDQRKFKKLKKITKEFLLSRKHFAEKNSNSIAKPSTTNNIVLNNIEWRINQMVPGEWFDNNHCQVEMNNRLARLEIFKLIETATLQIDMQFYIFKDSRFGQELGVALSRAASRGVQVRLMVDALWSGENFLGTWNSFLKRVGKIKRIHIVAADALTFKDEWDMTSVRQRDHRKLIIIDKKIAFVGGRNGADEYYYDWSEVPIADWTMAEKIPWLDAHAQLSGPIVKEIQNLFDRTWKRSGGKDIGVSRHQKIEAAKLFEIKKETNKKSEIENKTEKKAESRIKLVVHEGTHDANGLAAYEALICGAKKKLILVNDFPVLDDVAEMLIQAVNRGVKVSFLTGSVLARRIDGSFFEGGRHRELFEYVVKSRLGVLADAGVKVYEFQTEELSNIAVFGDRIRPYVHAKLITADHRYASIGSANLDITASYWEREANVLIDDVKVIKALDRQLECMMEKGIKLDTSSAEWKRERPQREIVARLWPNTFLN